MTDNQKQLQENLKELEKETERFWKRTEEVSRKLTHDYEELIKSFHHMHERTLAILEKCRNQLEETQRLNC